MQGHVMINKRLSGRVHTEDIVCLTLHAPKTDQFRLDQPSVFNYQVLWDILEWKIAPKEGYQNVVERSNYTV